MRRTRRFEYKVVWRSGHLTIPTLVSLDGLRYLPEEEFLQEWAADGWRLVAVMQSGQLPYVDRQFYFEKELT